MMQQLLLGSAGLIDPTIAIGALAFSDTDTQTYPGNGVGYTRSDDTYVIPNNWRTKDWTYKVQITSTASYVCLGYNAYVYKNGLLINSWSTSASNNGYFRNNSGTRTHTETLSLEAGDTVRGLVIMRGRAVGGSTPSSTNYHELKRDN